MEELGPFLTKEGADQEGLRFNPHSWNNAANLLFLDQPVGVGFSYTNNASDLQDLGDDFAVADSYQFLINWFKRFPEYRTNDFYLSGESYAGRLVLQLAQKVFDANHQSKENYMNLKGFITGNPPLDLEMDQKDMVYSNRWYGWSRSFNCPKGYPPCMSRFTEVYMNKMEVQEAIHANLTGIRSNWTHCSDLMRTWRPANFSIDIPIINKLVQGGLRIWVYSGDADSRIPVAATRLTLNKLGLHVKKPRMPWYHQNRIAGWTINYDGLTFVTVRGAGHRVPASKPDESYQIISYYLSGKVLPSTRHG